MEPIKDINEVCGDKSVAEVQSDLAKASADVEKAEHDIELAEQELAAAKVELEKACEHQHEIHFTVDAEECETHERFLKPDYIIKHYGEKDPATHYLVQIEAGHRKESYQGKGEIPIEVHECARFQVISLGPTPVSDGVLKSGVEPFVQGLLALGYNPAPLPGKPDHIAFDYEVETGRFAGQVVKLGFIVPSDFPLSAPSGPHVSPHVRPINPEGEHPAGRIHLVQAAPFAAALGGNWQYWSRPFTTWLMSKKTVAAYMSHVWCLWDSQ